MYGPRIANRRVSGQGYIRGYKEGQQSGKHDQGKAHFDKSEGRGTVPGRKMNAGGNPMAWFYEIRDSNKAVTETGKGFATNKAAMTAGRKRARELKALSSLPSGGVGTVGTGQDSEVPDR